MEWNSHSAGVREGVVVAMLLRETHVGGAEASEAADEASPVDVRERVTE